MKGRLRIESDGTFGGTRVYVHSVDHELEPIELDLPVTAVGFRAAVGEAFVVTLSAYTNALDIRDPDVLLKIGDEHREMPLTFPELVLDPPNNRVQAISWGVKAVPWNQEETPQRLELVEWVPPYPAQELPHGLLHRLGLRGRVRW